jgi:hypothetical protein
MQGDGQRVGQDTEIYADALRQRVALAGMGVKDLGEAAGQTADVAQVKTAAPAPRSTVWLAAAVGREPAGTAGTQRRETPCPASHPGIHGDHLPWAQPRLGPGFLDLGHDLVTRHVGKGDDPAQGVVGCRLEQDLLDIAAADAGAQGSEANPVAPGRARPGQLSEREQ